MPGETHNYPPESGRKIKKKDGEPPLSGGPGSKNKERLDIFLKWFHRALLAGGLAGGGFMAGDSVGTSRMYEKTTQAQREAYHAEEARKIAIEKLAELQAGLDMSKEENNLLSKLIDVLSVLSVKPNYSNKGYIIKVIDAALLACQEAENNYIEYSKKAKAIEEQEEKSGFLGRPKAGDWTAFKKWLEKWVKDPKGSEYWYRRRGMIKDIFDSVRLPLTKSLIARPSMHVESQEKILKIIEIADKIDRLKKEKH